jgi:phage replication-related protein YjqB (UPF0714/DUF867 family)
MARRGGIKGNLFCNILIILAAAAGTSRCQQRASVKHRAKHMKSDIFPNLDSLKRELRRGRDYRSRAVNRGSIVTVIAPHGGFIDEGSSAIARAVASGNFNLFDFQGLHKQESFRLHVTSHRFEDPALTRLIDRSIFALSIHGMADESKPLEIWLGGLNHELKQLICDALLSEGFAVNASPPRFRGEHARNVVNLPKKHGVQIELPYSLRKAMFRGSRMFFRNGRCPKTTELFDKFVRAVRKAASDYEHQLALNMVPEPEANANASSLT